MIDRQYRVSLKNFYKSIFLSSRNETFIRGNMANRSLVFGFLVLQFLHYFYYLEKNLKIFSNLNSYANLTS